ncbi:hypothetical protein ASF27_13470 [Methylobacterium sp. Leaf102]|uniref:hypothetical protein n=1 Tax=Methylobacterium sp. Leaf102 TaxID=1736253 RepID=UPI0006FC0F71|nr:hypothetical protein [Methylobacterium sp. Leaf102]KQP23787.1 hypothetical protein ASF27_13470 [Methylobacterium sp. Leaf102]
MRSAFLFLALFTCYAAYPAHAETRKAENTNVKRVEVDTEGGKGILVHALRLREAVTIQDVRAAMSDSTLLTHNTEHGTQVEFATKDGKVYLWYPGNDVILEGRWKPEPFATEFMEKGRLVRRLEQSRICFSYPAASFNPATRKSGGGWECTSFEAYRPGVKEWKDGDILSLRGRKDAPFVLPAERTTLDSLRSRIRS